MNISNPNFKKEQKEMEKIGMINKWVKRCAVNKNDRVAQKTKANTVECITKQSTKNFRSDNILGGGGFGKVYKGLIEEKFGSELHGTGSIITQFYKCLGDTKGSGKAHEGSSKRDGAHPNHTTQDKEQDAVVITHSHADAIGRSDDLRD
ncbi:hypothetical protein L1987_44305 [Smallanthus sonchifolius]|uniref:Uncharacterized protein n=1 Tax=Smallanthus sonchifolius TaxID=185202 RepID=A0ACB9GQ54_9ASTR|nr:hypothetical protein L1987_44305 [Smallanthus sonchifolius]